MTMKYNTVMYKVNNRTKLFIRFLREKKIKYIFVEEALRDAVTIKIINNNADGDVLKHFDKLFTQGVYDVIGYSFRWGSTKNGYDFWCKMFDMWKDYLRIYNAHINR